MLYNLSTIRQQVCQYAGITNSLGAYDLDNTTFPTIDLGNNMINDTLREITSAYDYQFLESSKSYPFYHVISGVQSVQLYATGNYMSLTVSGVNTITPYPPDVLTYSWLGQNSVADINSNFAGIHCPFNYNYYTISGVSVSGNITTANWTGVGFVYQMDPDVDKFLAPGIVVAHMASGSQGGQGIILQNTPYEDIVRMIPIGVVNASGTPTCFYELPGLNASNNNGKAIQFFPFPQASYSGSNFIVNYKKKHVDLLNDTDIQNVIPEQFQNCIVQSTLAKVYSIRTPDRQDEAETRANRLIASMRTWDANQPSKMNAWRDASRNTNSSFLYDNSTWLSLGDGPR